MSIPPLVCSTPPPPDQCEEDKHIDEFDLQYRLSQEDDDENEDYNYGHFSNFNQKILISDSDFQKIDISEEKLNDNEIKIMKFSITTEDEHIHKSSSYDDVAIEDLNLKIEQENDDTDLVESNISNEVDDTDLVESNIVNEVDDSDNYGITCVPLETESPNKNILICNNSNLVLRDNNVENVDEKTLSEPNSFVSTTTLEESPTPCEDQMESEIVPNVLTPTVKSECRETESELKIISNDFDDFEDFKFSTESNYEAIESAGNPWESNEPEDFNFGNFKANFDSDKIKHNEQINDRIVNTPPEDTIDDDDFGDFDDFKSSAKFEEQISPHVTVLNLQSNNDSEAQVIESINNILFNIFSEDLPDSEIVFDGNLETLLCETWHHLKEVDERQPYIVYWNNSLGQKTLLKALCIDSRNILFGTKWNSLMPKYANLSAAPLKPQKPVTLTTSQQSDISIEKNNKAENLLWPDPFTTTGQEYTYAEALLLDLEHLMTTLDQMAHKQSTLKISELLSTANNSDREKTSKDSRPADLDVFGNSITVTKLDKINSSTLSVQPFRHINLPDTHIFTPTDSETPRSKTIHYDNRPPVLLPQSLENHQIKLENSASKEASHENCDDYWEFQDFKATTETQQNTEIKKEETNNTNVDNIHSNPGITLQTQMLQPVKVEPIMPTLNWPDPGEVKETFDDFSDFISSTNWNNDNSSTVDVTNVLPSTSVTKTLPTNHIEDEFETFQSGPTPMTNHIKLNDESRWPETSQLSKESVNNNIPSFKPNKILSPNIMQDQNNMSNVSVNEPSKPSPCILQMINTVSSASRAPHVGQILQPLSLESYSQINWQKPGIDLQNLSSFNPLESLEALKSDSSSSGTSKGASPVHKINSVQNETPDDDIWGDFVSSKPKQSVPKKPQMFADDDEWTDFVSSPSISQNSLKTISFDVHTNSTTQKNSNSSISNNNQTVSLDIPVLNYITPKSNSRGVCIDKHFQNL